MGTLHPTELLEKTKRSHSELINALTIFTEVRRFFFFLHFTDQNTIEFFYLLTHESHCLRTFRTEKTFRNYFLYAFLIELSIMLE